MNNECGSALYVLCLLMHHYHSLPQSPDSLYSALSSSVSWVQFKRQTEWIYLHISLPEKKEILKGKWAKLMTLSDCGQNNIDSLVNLTLAIILLHHQNITVFETHCRSNIWGRYDFFKCFWKSPVFTKVAFMWSKVQYRTVILWLIW